MATRTYIEAATKRAFACTLDWPGWCRSGREEQAALIALAAAAPRYAAVASEAGLAFDPEAASNFEIIERVRGGATTDFGALEVVLGSDSRPIETKEATRTADLVRACWSVFDRVVESSPAELRKGPRGGGRDRDVMVSHVLGAEVAYARKLGLRIREPEPDDRDAIVAERAQILDVLSRPSDGSPPAPKGWPPRYAARRIAWHVMDHAWEMEDRSP